MVLQDHQSKNLGGPEDVAVFFWWVFQFSFVFHCIFPRLLPYIFIIEKKKSFLICVCTYIFLAKGASSCPLQFVLWVFPSPLTGSLLV